MILPAPLPPPETDRSPLDRYHACKAMARGYAESKKTEKNRLAHARGFCAAVIDTYWDKLVERHGTTMKIRPVPVALPNLPADVRRVAESIGALITEFPTEDAGYLIGSIYTVMLPDSIRSEMGAYYTPPPLVARLLDLAEAAGFDFSRGSAIDPACGGGAFLAPLALRMVAKSEGASPDWIVRSLSKRLRGVELDPFAAWMTRVLLDAAVIPICVLAKRRLADVVVVADALDPQPEGTYDLVIGNPPYGRLKLSESMRERYARSLYGHANLYGLFTDLALRLAKPTGVVAYLTPTSFLGGQYFKALRELLTTEASPVAFDFVSDRHGVFDDVLQETLLATYTRAGSSAPARVSALVPQGLNAARVEPIWDVEVDKTGGPWLLPRTRSDAELLRILACLPTRLGDLGYAVSTGPLVWNRYKKQLSNIRTDKTLPLIWAESVSTMGFEFSAERRNHVPYFVLEKNQEHLVLDQPCILVQRTTSKEQGRRLVAAAVPQKFLDIHGGAIVENHLNMVYAVAPKKAPISLETIEALLNSRTLDRVFRCISGSVAVSAYEINALPLPSVKELSQLDLLVKNGGSAEMIEMVIATCYGVL